MIINSNRRMKSSPLDGCYSGANKLINTGFNRISNRVFDEEDVTKILDVIKKTIQESNIDIRHFYDSKGDVDVDYFLGVIADHEELSNHRTNQIKWLADLYIELKTSRYTNYCINQLYAEIDKHKFQQSAPKQLVPIYSAIYMFNLAFNYISVYDDCAIKLNLSFILKTIKTVTKKATKIYPIEKFFNGKFGLYVTQIICGYLNTYLDYQQIVKDYQSK